MTETDWIDNIPTPRWAIYAAIVLLVVQAVMAGYQLASPWSQNPGSVWTIVALIFAAGFVYLMYAVPIAVMLKYRRLQ